MEMRADGRIKDYDLKYFLILSWAINPWSGYIDGTLKDLAEEFHCSIDSLRRSVSRLIKLRVVARISPYRFLIHPDYAGSSAKDSYITLLRVFDLHNPQ